MGIEFTPAGSSGPADTDALSEGAINLYSQWTNETNGIDYSAGVVGIGASPTAGRRLDIKDGAAEKFYVSDSVVYAIKVLYAGAGLQSFGTTDLARPGTVYWSEHATQSFGGGPINMSAVTTTADATPDEITNIAVPEDQSFFVVAKIHGFNDDDGSQACYYELRGLFRRATGGNVTQVGSTVKTAIEDDAGLDADFSVDTGDQEIDIVVTGLAATNFQWKAFYQYSRNTF